jgi:hypothetical protein
LLVDVIVSIERSRRTRSKHHNSRNSKEHGFGVHPPSRIRINAASFNYPSCHPRVSAANGAARYFGDGKKQELALLVDRGSCIRGMAASRPYFAMLQPDPLPTYASFPQSELRARGLRDLQVAQLVHAHTSAQATPILPFGAARLDDQFVLTADKVFARDLVLVVHLNELRILDKI